LQLYLRSVLPLRQRLLQLWVWVRIAALPQRSAGDKRWTISGRPVSYGPMSLPFESAASELAERDPSSPDILRLLLDNHAPFLGFLDRRVGCRDETEDILQEAFVRSVGRTDALQTPESATAWFNRHAAALSPGIRPKRDDSGSKVEAVAGPEKSCGSCGTRTRVGPGGGLGPGVPSPRPPTRPTRSSLRCYSTSATAHSRLFGKRMGLVYRATMAIPVSTSATAQITSRFTHALRRNRTPTFSYTITASSPVTNK
jgi:hypothetical protein